MTPWKDELAYYGLEDPDNLGHRSKSESKKITELADRIAQLQKKLYTRAKGNKPRSRLVDPKTTKIPGFAYHFRKD